MKSFKDTYVIIKQWEGYNDFFTEYISFDKEEVEIKCLELNKEFNDNIKKKDKNFIEIICYLVMDLKSAIEKHKDEIIDCYIEHDESY